MLNGLGPICLNGASVGSGMRRSGYRETKKIASSQAEDDAVPAYIHSAKGCSFDFVLRVVPPDASGSDRTRSLFELGADNRQLKQRASSTLVQHVQSDCSPSPFRPLSNRPL